MHQGASSESRAAPSPLATAILSDSSGSTDSRWESKAFEELNDAPELRSERLQAFREAALNNQREWRLKNPGYTFTPIMDDAFLMAFLRTRKFDMQKALRCLERFYEIRLCNPEKILPVGKGPRHYPRVLDKSLATVLRERNPLDGSYVVVWDSNGFDPNEDELADVFNMSFYAAMEIITAPSVQTFGVRFVFDQAGFRLSHCTSLLAQMYCLKALIAAQAGFPVRILGFHFVNDTLGLSRMMYKVVRPFVSAKLRERIHFHGNNLPDLHKSISTKILPESLGGMTGPVDASWLKEAFYSCHDSIVFKSNFGYR